MELAVAQVAFSESELPLAISCSRRAAKRIAKEIGRRVGGRRLILREDLVQYLRSQPQGRVQKSSTPDQAHEFRIR